MMAPITETDPTGYFTYWKWVEPMATGYMSLSLILELIKVIILAGILYALVKK